MPEKNLNPLWLKLSSTPGIDSISWQISFPPFFWIRGFAVTKELVSGHNESIE
jgi:hypothetical protein